jgi:SAM-dependent methyltransferase
MSLKRAIPWWAKIGGKLVLSRLPFGYRFWRGMNLFVHGAMQRPQYAVGVVRTHLGRVGWSDLTGRTILELGPGDSLATAVISKALGATRVILVDVGDFATRDLAPYRELAAYLRSEGLSPPDIESCKSREDVLAQCDAEYHTSGLASMRALESGSVDLVFSHAVLAHVRRAELRPMLEAMYRVTTPSGVASHQIDLRDHLGGSLNHLRFSERVWEADWMARSGFYTNRVRFSPLLEMMRVAGWECDIKHSTRWPSLPIRRSALAAPFQAMSDNDLLVSDFAVVGSKSRT